MASIDNSIVNVAVPHMRGAVGATIEEITWVATGYALAQVIVMALTAFLGRLFGQKQVYLFCLALFIVGSALCGMARTLTTLVAFRFLQGFGAGALQPTVQAILRQTFPYEEQGMAMAMFGMIVMIGPAVGPTLGGYIVDNYSWPWIFYINLPIGVAAILLVWKFVHEPEDIRAANHALAVRQRKHMDWAGIILLSVFLCTMQYALEEGQRNDWFESPAIRWCAIVCVFSFALFIVRELSATVPAVDLRLFKDPVFLSGTLVGCVQMALLFSLTFLLPVFMQEVLGFTATQSGIALVPRTVVMMACMPIIGRLYNVVSPRILVATGVVLFSVSAFQMSHYTLDTSSAGIVSALALQGVAFSCLFVPLTTVALSTIPRHKIVDAASSNSLVRQVGASIGIAVFATMLTRSTVCARHGLVAHLYPGRPEVMARLDLTRHVFGGRGGLDAATSGSGASALLDFSVTRQAMVLAFERMFLLAGIIFLGVLPLVFLLRTGKKMAPPRVDVHVEA
jgi:DHA2 family multidrug resistance protein